LTAKNAAGHDAAFEAECADKEAVVNWLLGKMDEVEKEMRGGGSGHQEDEGETVADEGKDGDDEEEVELMRAKVGDMEVDEKK